MWPIDATYCAAGITAFWCWMVNFSSPILVVGVLSTSSDFSSLPKLDRLILTIRIYFNFITYYLGPRTTTWST